MLKFPIVLIFYGAPLTALKGTIRGKKNAVRASLEVFTGEQMLKGKVVAKKMPRGAMKIATAEVKKK